MDRTNELPLTPFGKWLQDLQGDMTETDLAAKIGLSRQQLRRIKTGQTGLSQKTIMALAAAVNGKSEDALRLAFSPNDVTADVEVTQAIEEVPLPLRPAFVELMKTTAKAWGMAYHQTAA